MAKVMLPVDIDRVEDCRFEDLPVPEWGQDAVVRVQYMDGGIRDDFERFWNEQDKTPITRARLIALVMVDQDNKRLTPVEREKAVTALSKRDWLVLDRLAARIMAMNKLGGAQLEDEVKNSEGPTGINS